MMKYILTYRKKKKKKQIIKSLADINNINNKTKPYLFKLLDLNTTVSNKIELFNKISNLNLNNLNTDNQKYLLWIESVFKIPFGIYQTIDLDINRNLNKVKKHLLNSKQTLDKCVYGHKDAKNKILQIIAQTITNNNSKGLVLGIQGPMGNGKTSFLSAGKKLISIGIIPPISFSVAYKPLIFPICGSK